MTAPNIDTKALRELRDDACKLDGHSLMEVLHAQQKYERAIIAAAPALLELAERAQEQAKEIGEARSDAQRWVDRAAYYRNIAIEAGVKREAFDAFHDQRLVDMWATLRAERDALKAEVAWRQGAHDTLFKTASEIQAERNDLRSKLSASEREAERLRADVAKVCDDWVHGDTHTTDWLLSRLMPIAQRGFALRGEEAPRE